MKLYTYLLKSCTIRQFKNEKLQPRLRPSVGELPTPRNSLVRLSGDLISCLSPPWARCQARTPSNGSHVLCGCEPARSVLTGEDVSAERLCDSVTVTGVHQCKPTSGGLSSLTGEEGHTCFGHGGTKATSHLTVERKAGHSFYSP